MQNQQIISRLYELEKELKKIKAALGKKPTREAKVAWSKINFLENQIQDAKSSIFDFDIEKFISKNDISSWK